MHWVWKCKLWFVKVSLRPFFGAMGIRDLDWLHITCEHNGFFLQLLLSIGDFHFPWPSKCRPSFSIAAIYCALWIRMRFYLSKEKNPTNTQFIVKNLINSSFDVRWCAHRLFHFRVLMLVETTIRLDYILKLKPMHPWLNTKSWPMGGFKQF